MMHYQLFAGDNPVKVYQWPCRAYDIKTYSDEIYKHIADEMAFAILTGEGSVEFTVVPDAPFENVKIRPLSAGISHTVSDGKILFTVDKPVTLSVELDGNLRSPLFVFYSPRTPVPAKCDYYYGPGEHDVGLVNLTEGQTVYVDEGAIVYGAFHAVEADNVTVIGEGIISGMKMHRDEPVMEQTMLLDFIRCKNVRVGAMTLYDGPVWLCRAVDCDCIEIDGLREISMNPSGDGIDICNSRHAHIRNCFMRTNDDCITIKALFKAHGEAEPKPMYDIVSEGCVCWSATHGNGLEVGYETCTAEMYDIHFKNCDIIHCEQEGYQSGGTLTIHNGDRADIHHVYYENIRIEDSREKIFDLKICSACWSHDPVRGRIRDVFFKDIAVVDGPFPPSIIRGFESKSSEFAVKWDENGNRTEREDETTNGLWVVRDLHDEGTLRDITIENFTVYGKRIENFMDAKCVCEISTNVVFK